MAKSRLASLKKKFRRSVSKGKVFAGRHKKKLALATLAALTGGAVYKYKHRKGVSPKVMHKMLKEEAKVYSLPRFPGFPLRRGRSFGRRRSRVSRKRVSRKRVSRKRVSRKRSSRKRSSRKRSSRKRSSRKRSSRKRSSRKRSSRKRKSRRRSKKA